MFQDIIQTFFFSLSPLGEGRVGIPFGMLKGLHPFLAYVVGTGANLLVFPLFTFLLNTFHKKLWKFKPYKSRSIKMIRNAKNGVGAKIHKYGFWGLMIFVMIPLPATGAYIGSIAAILFKVPKRKAFPAISIGVVISALIIAVGTYFGILGIESV